MNWQFGTGKMPVIHICRKGELPPFDIAQERTVFYDPDNVKSVNNCIDDIRKQIESIENEIFPPNTVAEIIQHQESLESRDELKRRYGELSSRITSIDKKIADLVDHVPSKELLDQYRDEITTLRSLKEAGIVSVHRNREIALRQFMSAIDAETQEIMIVGSSLLGLLQKAQYKELADKLRFKVSNSGVRVKFLLTHPAVSDLRAEQENRRFAAIGREIIQSLRILSSWDQSLGCQALQRNAHDLRHQDTQADASESVRILRHSLHHAVLHCGDRHRTYVVLLRGVRHGSFQRLGYNDRRINLRFQSNHCGT